ncbi:MAG: hypothetical protein ACRC10_03730 [Thermoguttaceae bacterium]
MRKLKLFLDTSVISHIDAPHKPYEEVATKAFFRYLNQHREEYELVISAVVKKEIDACPKVSKRDNMINLIDEFQVVILPFDEESEQLAQSYIKQGVLSSRSIDDLTHVAYAVVNNCNHILSWNFKHFVNLKTINAVNGINEALSYRRISIITPQFFIGETTDD